MGRFTISPQASSPPGRFSVGRFYVPPEEEPWQATASPLVQKRKRPDGTWETRPTPRQGQEPTVTPAPEKSIGQTMGDLANRAITASAEGMVALPEILLSRREHGSTGAVTNPDLYGALTPKTAAPGSLLDLKGGREDIRRQYEQRQDEFREANLPPPVTASLDTLAEAVGPAEAVGLKGAARWAGRLLDPTAGIEGAFAKELAEAAPVPRVERRLNTALRQAVEAEIPRVRAMTTEQRRALMASDPGEAVERAIERVEFMEAKGTHAGPPAVAPQVPPQRVRTSEALESMPPERPSLASGGPVARDLPPPVGRGGPESIVAHGAAGDVSRETSVVLRSDERPWFFVAHPSTREPGRWQLTRFEGDEPTGHTTWASQEAAVAAAKGQRVGGELPVGDWSFRPEGLPAPERPAFVFPGEEKITVPRPAPSASPPRMSTKGLETFKEPGLREGMEQVARDNFDEIYAARGPVVPVTQWHDAAGLQAKLKLAPEDYLATPAGRTFSSDELALGKHYLGDMKLKARELEARIASGQVDDVVAAQAEKAARNRDVVRMMAVLQGQGSSEAGRSLRMLQEALDPHGLAETPKERLQLALVKHYGAKNADAAAAIEQKAVAVLRRRAAREARKTARAATAQELSAEFSSLAANLGDLIKHPKGMGGGPVPLDPELVAVIGKMASNRVRAGVVAVEELVDHVYSAVRQYAGDAITREQVKASLVEHALAKPGKQTRLERAEAAARRAVKQLEERAAGAPGPAKPTTSPWSAELGELRLRQAGLREQLRANPTDQRLAAAERRAQQSIERLESRIAAGGAKAPKAPSLSSPALDKLRARQAELREQLAALRKPPTDPAARRLKTAEGAVARQVKKLEEKLAAGPQLPAAKVAAAESERLSALRQRAADLRSQIEKDPRHSLVQRYRELLDKETVDMISKLPDPLEEPDALVNFLRQMEKPTFRDFRTTYWLNSILSGTKTAVRNLAGNFAKIGVDTAMRPLGAAVEQYALAPLQGRAPARLVRETLPATAGVFRGIPDGIRKFAFVMKNGYDPARLVGELTGDAAKWHEGARLPLSPFLLSQNRAIRAVGVPLTMPSRILEATDALFKTMAATSEGYAWATRRAIQEGAGDIPARVAQILAEQPDEMIKAQTLAAQKATYTDPSSWIGDIASAARRGIPGADRLAEKLRSRGGAGNRALAATVQAPQTVMQHLVPFIHVSDRVAASITDFVPFSKPGKLAAAFIPDDLWQGLPAPVERYLRHQPGYAADFLARQTVGAALGLLGLSWAADGKLVGSAPKDEKLRNDFYAEGKQPYSVLIGDRWVPMRDALGPLAGPFVAAAAYQDHAQVGDDPTPAIGGMVLSSTKYMLDASYMQTLEEVISAVEDGAEGKMGRGLTSAAARVAGGYVPFSGLVRNVATAQDPRVVDKQGFIDELKAGIPGRREELPARIGTLGEELRISTGAAGGFLPIVPTENRVADPALAEDVERLRYTVARRRTEINRVVDQIKDARKAKDAARVRELSAQLPGASDRVQGDAAIARVRGIEQQIRKLRANENVSEDRKREREIYLQKQMQAILSKALQRMGGE